MMLGCFAMLSSCSNDDDDNKGTAPAPVNSASTVSGPGEIILKWKNPDDVNFFYVDIAYADSKGVKRNAKISKYKEKDEDGFITDTIGGFTDTNTYTFALTACSERGAAAESVEVSGQPGAPLLVSIPPTISVKPDFGGAVIEWTNESGKEARVIVAFPDPEKPDKVKKVEFDASQSGKGYLSGLPATSMKINVSVQDGFYNESEPVSFTLTPYAESKIPKAGWSIPGYNPNSSAETIGYSSQAINEGGDNKAIAIFDDKVNTFWHASWSGPSTQYPHWIIVDMGQDVTISRIELTRRQGNSQAQKGEQILTCSAANAANPNDPTTWGWEDQGTYPFDITINDAQSVRLVNNPKARYIKLYFGTDVKGSSNYAMLAEMTVYGAGQN
jgi:hypothetical protein